eukprot:Sspe_Gene.11119::Locus_3747_Transcript_8_15_Confidence_0.083_Length_788::g.11119::m.11119
MLAPRIDFLGQSSPPKKKEKKGVAHTHPAGTAFLQTQSTRWGEKTGRRVLVSYSLPSLTLTGQPSCAPSPLSFSLPTYASLPGHAQWCGWTATFPPPLSLHYSFVEAPYLICP